MWLQHDYNQKSNIAKVGEIMEGKSTLVPGSGKANGVTIMKNTKVTQNVKNRKNRTIIGFTHSTPTLFTQNNLSQSLKDILALSSSLQQ